MKKLFQTSNSYIIFVLRLWVGLTFMAHGSQKLFGLFGGHGIQEFAAMLSHLGLPYPTLQAYLAGSSEFFGGLFLVLGLLTRLAALPPIVVMCVAIFKVHWAHGFFGQGGGFEYPLLLCVLLLIFVVNGAGKFSTDREIYRFLG